MTPTDSRLRVGVPIPNHGCSSYSGSPSAGASGHCVGTASLSLRNVFSRRIFRGAPSANLLGCVLIGGLWVLATEYSLSQEARVFVFTGAIGSLTTFSTYGLESLMLLREGRIWVGVGNILLSNVLGLALVVLGVACTFLWLGKPVPVAGL